MLIGSTWEPHRSLTGESPWRRRSWARGAGGVKWGAAGGFGAAVGCGDRRYNFDLTDQAKVQVG